MSKMSELEATSENILNNYPELSLEQDDMKTFLQSALSVVTLKIIQEENDLKKPVKRTNSFKPEMAHQVFGENEMIFGYKHLSITLNYLHNSAKCLVEINYAGKYEANTNISSSSSSASSKNSIKLEPDNIEECLQSWLPENYTKNSEVFLKLINEEEHDKMYGDILNEFKANDKTYKVVLCDTSDSDFKQFHQRFETFLVWFIDGANPIDIDDLRWMIFYIYEEEVGSKDNKIRRSPIGVCTVYKFFLGLTSIRPRISQFFILPTHQRKGIGTNLYKTVFNHLKSIPEVVDITVEEPTEVFQKIRDFCDGICIYEQLDSNGISTIKQNYDQVKIFLKNHKIGKKQCQRVLDILACLHAERNGRKDEFMKGIKKRIEVEMTKESRGSKRMCNADRVGIAVESANLNERIDDEFQRYAESLDWPLKRLNNYFNVKINGK